MPMHDDRYRTVAKLEPGSRVFNEYEVKLIKSFANTYSTTIFQQKSVRAYIDYMWPIAKG